MENYYQIPSSSILFAVCLNTKDCQGNFVVFLYSGLESPDMPSLELYSVCYGCLVFPYVDLSGILIITQMHLRIKCYI